MIRALVLAGLVLVLLLGALQCVCADAWIHWADQSVNQYMEPVEVLNPVPSLEGYVWQFGNSFNSPGPLVDDQANDFHTCDYPQHLNVVGGGSGPWADGDPSIPVYVRLVANVENVGTESWVDFHLRAISGCTIYPKYVMDNGLWSRFWDYSGDPTGWDYIMDPYWEPFWGAEYGPVDPGETFSFETWIQVTSTTGDFEVEFWPTAVPEPGSLLALAGGLVVLGTSIRRRKSGR